MTNLRPIKDFTENVFLNCFYYYFARINW